MARKRRYSITARRTFQTQLEKTLTALDDLTLALQNNDGILNGCHPEGAILRHSEIGLLLALTEARSLTDRALATMQAATAGEIE